MKALSIRQPWAWAIANAGKDVENRNWNMNHRGTLAIHASKSMTMAEYHEFNHFFYNQLGDKYHNHFTSPALPNFDSLVRGAVIAIVTAVDCVTSHHSPWFCGPYGLIIKKKVILPDPIHCKGQLGFFDLPKIESDIIEYYLKSLWRFGD